MTLKNSKTLKLDADTVFGARVTFLRSQLPDGETTAESTR